MLEIKLRVYDYQTKRMWYTDPSENQLKLHNIVINEFGITINFPSSYTWDPNYERILMENIVLKDNNGKEIEFYEKDIIEIKHPFKGRYYKGYIYLDEGKFKAKDFFLVIKTIQLILLKV